MGGTKGRREREGRGVKGREGGREGKRERGRDERVGRK